MLQIPNINLERVSDIKYINKQIVDRGITITLTNNNWPKSDYFPTVKVHLAHNNKALLLKFSVTEQVVRAINTLPNSPVWEDSCVELFISTNTHGYYNFEFNAIGTCFASFGTSRTDRKLLSENAIKQISSFSTYGKTPFIEKKTNSEWSLMVAIPLELMDLENIKKEEIIEANFYKCGNKLSKPHYLSYNKIETSTPDFHRPEYFGKIKLM